MNIGGNNQEKSSYKSMKQRSWLSDLMDETLQEHLWMNVDVSNGKKAWMIIEETNDMIFFIIKCIQ